MTVVPSDANATLRELPGEVRPKTVPPGRTAKIQSILERYADLTDPTGGRGYAGDGGGVSLMPHEPNCMLLAKHLPKPREDKPRRIHCTCSARSVVEIERLLTTMRQDRHRPLQRWNSHTASVRQLWWHVTERYVRCQHVTKDVHVRRRTKHGKMLTVVERRAVVQHHPQVNLAYVDRALHWLAQNWNADFEPMLPRELIAA